MKILTVLIAALILSSCSSTHQTRDIFKPSGFLKDYSKLRPGKEDQAQMRYVEPGVVFTKFKKITIDPIEVWASNESELKQIPKSELKDILTYLHSTFVNNLKGNFEIVDKEGPQTLRIRIALTDGESSEPVTDTLSNVVPITLAVSYLKIKVSTRFFKIVIFISAVAAAVFRRRRKGSVLTAENAFL